MKNKSIHIQVTSPLGQLVGFFDGEYVVSNTGIMLYRVDGDEVYTYGPNAKLLAYLRGNVANSISGGTLFTLS
jgi:hypothetical protein